MKITKRLPVKNITNFHPEIKDRVDEVLERKSLVSNFTALEDGEAIGVISTPSVDNDGDIIDPMGIKTDIYNGTVQWNHSLDTLPLGTITEFTMTPEGVKGKFKFSKSYDFATDVYNLIKENILKGISIGYIPLKALKRGTSAFNEYAKAKGWDVTDCERIITECLWIETSMVPVGCNNDALILASKAFKSDITTKAFKLEDKLCGDEPKDEKVIVEEPVNEQEIPKEISEVDKTMPEETISKNTEKVLVAPEEIKFTLVELEQAIIDSGVSINAPTEGQITPEVVPAESVKDEAIVIPEAVEPQPDAPKLVLKVLRKGKLIHTEEIKTKAIKFIKGKSF